jgi:hypothetical protein
LISIESALPRLKERVERQIPTMNAPGITLGLTHRDRMLHVGAYGLANREAGQPLTNFIPRSEITTEYKSKQTKYGLFLTGDDPRSPALIRFDVVIAGKAMQAVLPGGAYRRTPTP